MKKAVIGLLMLLLATPVLAQNRGPLHNSFASWYTVTTAGTTVTFPYNSRDITIHNGSSVPIAVDIRGGTIPEGFVSASKLSPSIFQLTGNTAIDLRDHVTNSITLRTLGSSASPVSVVTTY